MKIKILPYRLPTPYILSDKDTFFGVKTPAGELGVLCADNRKDFEKLIGMLKYHGDASLVPESMGAMTVWGLYHIAKQKKLPLIILSSGPYSALPYKYTPYREKEWLEVSREIRAYHEMAHVVSRALFPENKEPLRDEVIADYIGLLAGTGHYDINLAKAFLGIEGRDYRPGGRLENYLVAGQSAQQMMQWISEDMEWLFHYCSEKPDDIFGLLVSLEKGKALIRAKAEERL